MLKREFHAAHAVFRNATHHFLAHVELLQQLVHVLNGSAAARRDSFAPGRLDNVRIVAFFRRHRKDNRFRFNDFAFVDIVFVDLSAKPRHHRHLAIW